MHTAQRLVRGQRHMIYRISPRIGHQIPDADSILNIGTAYIRRIHVTKCDEDTVHGIPSTQT